MSMVGFHIIGLQENKFLLMTEPIHVTDVIEDIFQITSLTEFFWLPVFFGWSIVLFILTDKGSYWSLYLDYFVILCPIHIVCNWFYVRYIIFKNCDIGNLCTREETSIY